MGVMTGPQLWLFRQWASPEVIARLERCLDSEERMRADRFVFPHLRVHYVVAHAVLRCVLGQHLGRPPASLTWQSGPQGKPRLSDDPLEFNLSHANGWGMLAVGSHRRLGVDIDAVRPARVSPNLIDTVTSAPEKTEFAKRTPAEQAMAFYRLWVRKEAVIKAMGTGLSRSLSTIDVPIGIEAPRDAIVLRPELPNGRRLCLWDVPAPTGMLAALVVEHEADEDPSPPHVPTVLTQTQIDALV